MKKFTKKLLATIALTVVWVSVLFFQTADAKAAVLPWNVDIVITYGQKSWTYNLKDNLSSLSAQQLEMRAAYFGKAAKSEAVNELVGEGFSSEVAYCYIFCGFKDVLSAVKKCVNRKGVDAEVIFNPNSVQKFTYKEGRRGIAVDVHRLFNAMLNATGCGRVIIKLPTISGSEITVQQLRQQTQLRSVFSTTFNGSNDNRVHNILLATQKVNGKIVADGEIFSFNDATGERNERDGYKSCKVIKNGEYTDDFGGGVCQVSTTLFNAALLADLTIKSVFQHSLVPSYIAPGFDAMVAFPNCDLKFLNSTGANIYIEGFVAGRTLTFKIYGLNCNFEIVRESVEIERKPFTTVEIVDEKAHPELIFTDQVKQVRSGSDFVKSQSYLSYYKDGILLRRTLIRQNTYKLVDRVVARGKNMRPE